MKFRRGATIRHLAPVFKKWSKLHKEYCKMNYYSNDCLYWYKERTNIGVFAGAIWKLGGYVTEEWGMRKPYRNTTYSGRADLWFLLNGKSYTVEAKWCESSLSENAKKWKERIERKLKAARNDAVKVRTGVEVDYAMGIVFVVPYIAESEMDNLNKCWKLHLDELDKVDYDGLAYCFPHETRSLKERDEGSGRMYYYPGIIMISRVTKR